MSEQYTVTERLGRTLDGRIVPYEDPEAATLAYAPGMVISLEEARAAGLLEPEAKMSAGPENKMSAAPRNKAR